MFSVFIDFRMTQCRGYGGEKVSWWLVGTAMNGLLTQTQRVNIIPIVRYGRSNTTHT